jgi:hypothetical protein
MFNADPENSQSTTPTVAQLLQEFDEHTAQIASDNTQVLNAFSNFHSTLEASLNNAPSVEGNENSSTNSPSPF